MITLYTIGFTKKSAEQFFEILKKNKVKTKEYAKKYNYDKNSKIKIYVSADAPHTCNPDTISICVDLAKELNT